MARYWLPFAVITSVCLMISSIALAQGKTAGKGPATTMLGASVKGTFKKFVQNDVVEMDSAGRTVYVKIDTKAKTAISGSAEPSFLAPQMLVKIIDIEANALGETKGAVKKLDIVEPSDNEQPSFYTESAVSLVQKKLTKEETEKFNKYFVRGTITKITDNNGELELQIKVPNATVTAKVAPDCKIDVQSSQVRFARAGDEAEVREGSEVQQPAAPAAPAPKGKAPAKTNPTGANIVTAQPPRFLIATWFQVTAKEPLAGKKKPGAKK